MEKLSELVDLVVVKFSVPCLILPKAIVSYYLYFTTGFRSDAFDLPLPMWFPFDWKTPVGYSIAVMVQFVVARLTMRFIGCFLSIGVASFAFSLSVCKDLKYILNSIDIDMKAEPLKCQIKQQFIEFIDLHTCMKQLSPFENSDEEIDHFECLSFFFFFLRALDYFSDIFHAILTILFIGCTEALCLVLLMIQQRFHVKPIQIYLNCVIRIMKFLMNSF